MQEIRDLNKHLEKDNTELYGKLHNLKDHTDQINTLQSKITEYENLVKHQEFEMVEMRMLLDEKTHQVGQLSDEKNGVESDFRRLTELHHQQLQDWRRRESGKLFICLMLMAILK